jgi:HdeA/HdeB family
VIDLSPTLFARCADAEQGSPERKPVARLCVFSFNKTHLNQQGLELNMRNALILSGLLAMATIGMARAEPVDLSAYADANGFIDVQKLTCAQLANTYQEDANALTSWYSGWYNGLAHKHYADFKKARVVEHQLIEYCKANQEHTIIHAIAVILKEDRAEGLMKEQ